MEEPYGFREIVPHGDVLGRNLCLSEFHAAILLDRLKGLDKEKSQRRVNFTHLSSLISTMPGITLVTDTNGGQSTHYRICIRLETQTIGDLDVGDVARALQAELRLPVEEIDLPLDINPLFSSSAWFHQPKTIGGNGVSSLPVADWALHHCLTLPHWCLLGDVRDMQDIVDALDKILFHLRDRLPCRGVRKP